VENLKWSAYEYEEKARGTDWFWALGVIIVAGSITSIIYGNYFFAILLILGGLSLGMFAVKKPEMINYELGVKGLQIKNQLYPYEKIKSFFVSTEGNPTLFIKSERAFMPMISMPLDNISPQEVREIMLFKNIPEEEMRAHFSEKVMDSLGI
jgi:hypothetical protein